MQSVMENKYARGSVWRKWDLHVHTPASFFWKGGKKLYEMNVTEKEEEIKKFISTVNESDVTVFCLMDYWTFDWYLELKNYIDKNPGELKKTIFPGIELRIECPVDYRLNIHCILSDKLTNQELIDFKSELYIRSIDKKLSDESLRRFAKSLDASKAKVHGYNDPSTLSDDMLLELGSKTAEITKESLEKAFEQIPSESGFIILPYDTSDGLLKLDWKSHPHDDNYFMQTAHIFETRDQKNIDLISGNKTDENKDFFDNFYKTLGNKSKPCISGSDAHRFSDYGKYPSNRITWIKADPTFEGLKQIIFEPGERVKIQELIPEDKEDYFIIDKVKYIDDNFFPDEIDLNQNLTAIIGGKSTGKSILLRNIAQSIDHKEVDARIKEVGLEPYSKPVSDFRVIWRDGQENKKHETDEVNKKIIYIPQSYLNRLVDRKEDKTSIDDIIKNVLNQDDVIKNVFRTLDDSKRDLEKSITKNIEDIFYTKDDIDRELEATKKIGDKVGISAEINKLKIEISVLKNSSGMTEEDIKAYDSLASEDLSLKSEKEIFEKDLKELENLSKKDIFSFLVFTGLSSKLKESLSTGLSALKEKFTKEWNQLIDEKIAEVKEKIGTNSKALEENSVKLSPLSAKVLKSKSLEEKIKKLEIETKKLNEIQEKDDELKRLKDTFSSLQKELINNHSKFYEIQFIAKSEVLKQNVIVGELEFNMDVIFENTRFQTEFIDEVCNLRNLSKFNEVSLKEYKFTDVQTLKDEAEKIVEGILTGTITLKNNYTPKEAITRLLKNWFIYDFKIKQNGDELSEMSPGKKSFVLLKLLIELDNSKCPILLDQPEDDLDNRSIYNDLVQFIKTKKKERQIIIATHNPNLVVGADAECVIVANQKGEISKASQIYKFEYVEGSLENSFFNENETKVLHKQGIQQHVCDVLEGGKIAFEQRRNKYNLK